MKTKANEHKGQRSTYSVIFYIKKGNRKKNGLCPLMGRITIDGDSMAFSPKIDADPDLWDAESNRMSGKSRQSLMINEKIEKYIQKIDRYYDEILNDHGYITAELVKNALDGVGHKEVYLLKLFKEHNEEFKLRVGVDKAEGTYIKYRRAYDRLLDFIRYKYEKEDFLLRSLTLSFIEDYDFYLRNDRKMANNTISDHMTHLKKMIARAMRQGTLVKNPFFGFGVISASALVWLTFTLNGKYGEHGLMKWQAARNHPRFIINRIRIRRLFARNPKNE